MSSEFDRQNLVSIFVLEASDGLAALIKALHPPTDGLPIPQQLGEQFIVAHRIHGAAALYGYGGVAQLAKRLEMLLEQATGIPPDQWSRAVGVMRNLTQNIQAIVRSIDQGGGEDVETVKRCLESSEGLVEEADGTASSVSQEYVLPTLDPEMMSYFIPEAEGYLETIDELIRVLRAEPENEDATYRLFRAIHTLKGSAYTVSFQVIGDVAHPMENGMIAIREKRLQLQGQLLETITQAAGTIRRILQRDLANVPRLQHEVPRLIHLLIQMCERAETAVPSEAITLDTSSGVPIADQDKLSIELQTSTQDLPDAYLIPDLDPEILSYFVPEAQEYLEMLEANLLRLDKDPQNGELINQVFRTAHTLKGSAYTVGFQSIGDLTHHVEDFMGSVRDERLKVLPGHTDLMLRSIDVVRVLMRRDHNTVSRTRQRFDEARSELKRLGQDAVNETASVRPPEHAPDLTGRHPEGAGEHHGQGKPFETRSAEDREVIRVSYARLERLMNLVGELVIGRGRLEQRLRVLEQLSQQVLIFKTRLADSVQSFSDKHMFTYQEAPSHSPEASGQGFQGIGDFGSLELDKYDDFNILARRIGEVTADISESMSQLNGSIRTAHDDMSQLQQLTLLMRDEIAHARMVPIGTPFTRFHRAIREIARASNKEVTLVTSGEHTEVDTGIVERLVDPLVHLVRNAVYHGIESAADRVMKGKPAAGTVYLHAAHRGNSVIIEVEDDGAGLDLSKIRAKALKMGLIKAGQLQAMSDAEALQLIFLPGFSTADKVGDQAGRGVGLDVVKRVIEGMKGHIDVESEPGVGTKFTLSLPLTLLIATALLVRAGTERYAIPLPNILEVTLPTADSLQQHDDRMLLKLGDQSIEVHPLHHLLRRERGHTDWSKPVVIVRTPIGPVGLAVDELLGRQEIVIKSLGSLKPLEYSFFGGATIDPEGRVILVIDPARLFSREAIESIALETLSTTGLPADQAPPQETEGNDRPESHLLLIDDSLSIRKFVGRMLESAGYRIDTAVDGEDGLRKALASSYRLIITDLEMPKLNGFEVVQALRSRPETRQTPVVVMTTRAGDKHHQMAINIGANSYIAKPVEERMLLQEVERWVGRAPALRK